MSVGLVHLEHRLQPVVGVKGPGDIALLALCLTGAVQGPGAAQIAPGCRPVAASSSPRPVAISTIRPCTCCSNVLPFERGDLGGAGSAFAAAWAAREAIPLVTEQMESMAPGYWAPRRMDREVQGPESTAP
jgi:hypothetical protein